MQRLTLQKNLLASPKSHYVDSSLDYLFFSDFLNPEEQAMRKEIRQFCEQSLAPYINDSIETASFPDHLIPIIAKSDLLSHFIQKPYGKGTSQVALGVILAEIARVDGSLATFVIVQGCLAMHTIEKLGSEEQKQRYLPKMSKLELISGWGLTEKGTGSDASSLYTSALKLPNGAGYRINGDKRWIGNGNKDMLIVWARNQDNQKVEGFILDMKVPGVQTEKIKHKFPLRMVQNCQITFTNAIIPEENKLPKAIDFIKGTTDILKHSRVFVCWVALGLTIGVYDNAIKYVMNRKQFGVPIASFQLIQEKLSRIMGSIQSMTLMAWRITKLMEQGQASIGQISMVKAWITLRGREVCALGREILGGNGITFDNYVMKAMADMEALYTYEGTYEINSLINARELTGISAFKTKGK